MSSGDDEMAQCERELVEALREATIAIDETLKMLLTLSGNLQRSYPDDSRWSPWTRWVDRHEGTPWTLLRKAKERADTALAHEGGQDDD